MLHGQSPQKPKSSLTTTHQNVFGLECCGGSANGPKIGSTPIVLKKVLISKTSAFNDGMPIDSRHVGVAIDAVTDVTYSMDIFLMHLAGV